jgi:chromatin segregation and condensation protein Rec8/ScpA/Scc1 (kleisin family)
MASTFVAGLELAKQEVLGLDQSALFEPITYHPAPIAAAADRKRA